MARHIMAVCVVCLLCAEHLPCQQHVESLLTSTTPSSSLDDDNFKHKSQRNAIVYTTTIASKATPPHVKGEDERATTDSLLPYDTTKSYNTKRRRKRYTDHDDLMAADNSNERPKITRAFLERIFKEYGREDDDVIQAEDFQRLLKRLGLNQLIPLKSNSYNSETCIVDSKLVHYIKPHERYDCMHHHQQHHLNGEGHSVCVNSTEDGCAHGCATASLESFTHSNYTLSPQDLMNICPVLLHQLITASQDPEERGCIKAEILVQIDSLEAKHFRKHKDDILCVWIYAFVSVFACTILGLVGVAIIPFMDSRFYKHIIQFLVSLAVGTMTGDALLHLLPHSLAGQTESNMIFKGLTCMSGIVFFYITEHGLTMISEWRKSKEKKETTKPSRAKVMRDPDSSLNNSVAGDKMCKSKYSSYPYCYDEIAMDTKNDVWMHLPHNLNDNTVHTRNGKLDGEVGETAAQSLLSTSQNNYAPIAEANHQHHHNNHQQQHDRHQQTEQPHLAHNSGITTDLEGNIVGDGIKSGPAATTANGKGLPLMNGTVTVILREHESTHHGHSHKHGHVHSPPKSLSAVVWMIIMGDGLHNFTDGMAIGAAFAENIAGGFSTSLAVFCHELPHELGDFAILMKAGMSVKSAVYYNLLTGVLSFIGMIFGIVFGQSHETAQWIFAAAAGLFIYIALVDMMPEISAAHKSLEQFTLQILGMGSGVLLMLLIAIYEDDLMHVFSDSGNHQHIH
uniref:EF-hand domain-containing protein n=1 Tax=Glossina palpalis gambiensis TaxID=67801 RepID=A0A1B0BAA6_9MUSC